MGPVVSTDPVEPQTLLPASGSGDGGLSPFDEGGDEIQTEGQEQVLYDLEKVAAVE